MLLRNEKGLPHPENGTELEGQVVGTPHLCSVYWGFLLHLRTTTCTL